MDDCNKITLSDETISHYDMTREEMQHEFDVAKRCSDEWDAGNWSKSQIARYIASEMPDLYQAALCGMATGAMMEHMNNDPTAALLKALLKTK